MSISSDIRSYADNAVAEGRKVLDSTLTNAQASLNDVTGQANDFVSKYRDNVSDIAGKANDAAQDLRKSFEKAVNVDAIRSAVEPYLAQARDYQTNVQSRVEHLYAGVADDQRFAKVVDVVQERVVKPVISLTGLGGKPTSSTSTSTPRKPSPTKSAAPKKPATTKSATTTSGTSSTTTGSSTTKPAAKKSTTRKTTTRKSNGTSAG